MSDQASGVNEELVQHLQSRSVQPGVVRLNMGRRIISRVDQMAKPQTLVQSLGQRWQSTLAAHVDQVPFVYAQPPQPVPDPTASSEAAPLLSRTQSNRSKQAIAQPAASPAQKPTTPLPAVETELVLAQDKRPSTPASTKKTPKASQQQPVTSSKPAKTAAAMPSTTAKAPAVGQNQPQQTVSQPPAATVPTSEPITVAPKPQAAALPMAELPLPIVTAEEALAPPTAVSPPPLPTAPKAKAIGTPVSQTSSASSSSIVVVASQKATPAAPTMPVVTTNTPDAPSQLKPAPVVANKPQPTAAPPLAPSSRPLVKPQPAVAKTTPAFPSSHPPPTAPLANGRSPTPFSATNPLPIVRSAAASRSPMSASMPSSDMPLPKTGVATPVSSASTSGVIQRSALDDQTTTADMIDQGNAAEGTVDINEIVFEVQRQFRRELAIEGERRGATSWF